LQMRSLSAYVPPVALPFFAEAILVVADAVTRYPGDKSWALWLMTPTLLLWRTRGNITDMARAKYVATRAVWMVQGRVWHLWTTIDKVMRAYHERQRSSADGGHGVGAAEEFDLNRFTFLMSNGRVSEALDMAVGNRGVRVSFKDGVVDDATLELIACKVPQLEEPPKWKLTREEYNEQLKRKFGIKPAQVGVEAVHALYSGETASKRHGTGGSFSGWNFDMLFNALRVPSLAAQILRKYTDMCNMILRGEVSDLIADFLQRSPVVIVETGASAKRRVVFPQEVIFRDVGTLAARWAEQQEGFRAFFHNQYAMGVPNGALIPSIVLRSCMQEHAGDPSVGVVSRDIQNQFHTFDRARLILQIMSLRKKLDLRPLAFMATYLTLPTVGVILEADYRVDMWTGSAQGNGLSSLFAQFMFQPVMDKLSRVMSGKILALSGFADNMDAVIRAGHMREYLHVSQAILQEDTGMEFGLASDVAYFPGVKNRDARVDLQANFPFGRVAFGADGFDLDASRVDRCGTVVTGVPFGDSDYEHDIVAESAKRALAVMDKLRANKKISLVCWTKIVQECIIPRLSFMAQAISPTITRPIFAEFDRRVAQVFFAALDVRPRPEQVQQAQLPRSLGGFGLRRMELACVPAYLASQVKACNVVKAVVPLDFPQQINSYNMLVKKEDRLTDNKAGLSKLTRNSMKELTYAVWRNECSKLMAKLGDSADLTRLLIAAQPKTTMWCSSLCVYSVDTGRASASKNRRVVISDRAFRVLALNRLVCSSFVPAACADLPFPDGMVCGNVSKKGKVCHAKLDAKLVHSMSGCHFLRYQAHQEAANAVEFVARDLGFSVSHACGIPGMKKHADLMIYGLLDDSPATAIDVSVRNPYAKGALRFVPGSQPPKPDVQDHLVKAEKSKTKKYQTAYAGLGRGFKPFVVSSTGVFGSGAKEIVTALAKRYALQYYVPMQTAQRRVSEFIGCSILRQVAQNCLGAQNKVYTRLGADAPAFA
jgi:hypothetical protein